MIDINLVCPKTKYWYFAIYLFKESMKMNRCDISHEYQRVKKFLLNKMNIPVYATSLML